MNNTIIKLLILLVQIEIDKAKKFERPIANGYKWERLLKDILQETKNDN